MSNLSLRALCKKFGDRLVVNDVDLDVQNQEFVVLLGPSGCGKTTILRIVAGLEKETSGEILLDGRVINRVPPQQRDMAMVFQNYALYAHLSVFDNLAFSLRMHKVPAEQVRQRVKAVAQMLQIESLMERKPRQLSGGERQRVALGRAIVRQPRLFLMDEPLSNLDALLRIQTRTEILQLARKIGATVLYVTHDQTEAMTMGQRVVVLRDGRIQQVDTPLQIYNQPASCFVAEFVGTPPINFIRDLTLKSEAGRVWAVKEGFAMELKGVASGPLFDRLQALQRKPFVLGFRPEDVSLLPAGQEDGIPGRVEVVEPLGRDTLVHVDIGPHLLRMLVDQDTPLQRDERLTLHVDPGRLNFFDQETERNLAIGLPAAA